MRLLLDTSGLLHLAAGSLTPRAATALGAGGLAVISPVIPWELAIKVKNGKLSLPQSPLEYVVLVARRYRLTFSSTGLDAVLLCAAADLPLIHRDPFDRILIATAMRDHLAIVTPDRTVAAYPGVTTVW
jgi:PIN domain nuclease of toxin-antitoxin system